MYTYENRWLSFWMDIQGNFPGAPRVDMKKIAGVCGQISETGIKELSTTFWTLSPLASNCASSGQLFLLVVVRCSNFGLWCGKYAFHSFRFLNMFLWVGVYIYSCYLGSSNKTTGEFSARFPVMPPEEEKFVLLRLFLHPNTGTQNISCIYVSVYLFRKSMTFLIRLLFFPTFFILY